jgi:hypothetical protein
MPAHDDAAAVAWTNIRHVTLGNTDTNKKETFGTTHSSDASITASDPFFLGGNGDDAGTGVGDNDDELENASYITANSEPPLLNARGL